MEEKASRILTSLGKAWGPNTGPSLGSKQQKLDPETVTASQFSPGLGRGRDGGTEGRHSEVSPPPLPLAPPGRTPNLLWEDFTKPPQVVSWELPSFHPEWGSYFCQHLHAPLCPGLGKWFPMLA